MRSSRKAVRLIGGLILTASAVTTAAGAMADQSVASWVDDQGVTHFGNVQFAPDNAKLLQVADANRMDVPKNVPTDSATGPTWSVIEQAPKQNRKGWRAKGEGPQNGPVNRR